MQSVEKVIYDPFLPERWPNPIPAYKKLLKEYPIYHLKNRDIWIISRYEDVMNALKDWKTFSSGAKGNTINDTNMPERVGNTLGTTDPPKHDKLRRIVSDVFTPKYVASLEPEMRRIVIDLINNFRDKETFDFQWEFSYPYTARVVGKMIGIPEDKLQFFVNELSKGMRESEEHKSDPKNVQARFKLLTDFCKELVEMKKSNPGNDVISRLLAAKLDGEALTVMEVAITTFTLIGAAFQSTAMAIGCSISTLSKFPEQLRELYADPSLIPNMIEETLRYDGSTVGFRRTTTRDVELHDQIIPQGAQVFLNFGAANHDEARFENSEILDIRRKDNKHLGFGWGVHTCLGAPMARLMIKVAYEELLPVLGTEFQIHYDQTVLSSTPQFRGYVVLPMSL
ncbi:cytochrome P450 [Bacillus sp. FJAT-29953]|nr:cytochrome P450 [Bacillus sp. FJAT-29953]